jgi:cytochrome c-type biogenesis protein CcsB
VPVNTGLADVSNGLLLTTVVIYALAMLAYACDFAFSRTAVAATAPARVPELVGAASGVPSSGGDTTVGAGAGAGSADTIPATPRRRVAGVWVRAAFTLTCIGLAAHITGILTRGLSEHRVPWGNMFEFIMAITCMAVIVLVAVAIRYQAYYVGLFVMVPVVFALGLAVTVIYTPAGALVPALQSYWIAIHVTAMIVASGLYIVGAVVTVMYLAVDRYQRRTAAGHPSRIGGIIEYLPKALVLDRLSYRTILFAFPVWTFGIMAGAIWADQAWGRYWGWDPKETWSFITWVVYAGFLHARATAGWRGRRAAYIQLVGFGCLLFNLVGVNIWITGLHSYAGLS